ncbi:MAG: isocitrate lyase/PEP mutase family protein [Thermodesulfobacteriota bacterium]|nr:isocitrate lyase/PEP mutase family protein [Thermodesulfobacteriota bacterium]
MEKKSTKLRKLLQNKDELLIMVVVGTAHEAQLAEKIGFKALGISGSNTSSQILGLPDAGLITMTELVENVERICRAVDLPARVDCDTGFGNAINVRRTADSVIRAGAAALFMEDQVAPKRCGFVKGKELLPLDEAVGKYRAAVDVRNELDPDFIIMARTDARGAVDGSLEEVIRRGKAYLEAGVDIFYPEALQSREEIKQVRDALKDCLLYASTQAIRPPLTEQDYKELGLCMAISHVSRVGSVAMYDYLVELKVRGIGAHDEFVQKTQNHPLGGFGKFDLAGFPKIVEWEKKYLPQRQLEKYDRSLGIYDPRVGHGRKA